ncbi:MAG: hypothetical protein QF535_20095 [Anaerolineales bacterium]|nr:hypothetical protein [Anaerolineales bacterium]
MILNDNCVLSLDFTNGVTNGQINDLSTYGHHAHVVGSPEFIVGGSPLTDYISTVPSFMTVDGANDYLVIDHSEALALGKDNADFTISFALF